MRKQKHPYYKVDWRVRCTNCNRPLKKNVVERKTTRPKFCYHCFLSIVKKIAYISKTSTVRGRKVEKKIPLNRIIEKNKKRYQRMNRS